MAVCHAESVCSKEEVSVAAAALNNNNKKRVCCIASLSRPTTVKSSLQSRPVQTPPPWLPSASCYVLLSLRGQGSLVTFCIVMHCLPLSTSKTFLKVYRPLHGKQVTFRALLLLQGLMNLLL